MPEPIAKVIHELRGKLRALCTLLRAAEVLETFGHTDVAMEVLDIVDSCLSVKPLSFSAEGAGGPHLATSTCSSEPIARLSGGLQLQQEEGR